MAVWADNEHEAIEKCAEIHKGLNCYDKPFEAVVREWKAEEHYPAHDSDVFICYQKDMDRADDVRLIFVPSNIQKVEEYIIDQLAEIESQKSYFREYVNDKAVNMSFAERFWYDEEGYLFKPTLPIEVRDDIHPNDVDDLFDDNVYQFFGDNTVYRDEYFLYMHSLDEPFFDDDFYKFICKRLMELGDWTVYDNIRRVDIVA